MDSAQMKTLLKQGIDDGINCLYKMSLKEDINDSDLTYSIALADQNNKHLGTIFAKGFKRNDGTLRIAIITDLIISDITGARTFKVDKDGVLIGDHPLQ